MDQQPQPRRYRVRIFEENREALADRRYFVVLDLANGPALRTAEANLDAALQALAYSDGARGDKVRKYHLRIEDWTTSEFQFNWPAMSWPDRR